MIQNTPLLDSIAKSMKVQDKRAEGEALVRKWKAWGLLEGLEKKTDIMNMACILENQAKEVLREATTMGGGQVEGYANVAFPIVRRVFGNLLAQSIVAVQAMSLPNSLIFYLDFQTESTRLGSTADESVYGGNVLGQQLTGTGVDLSLKYSEAGFYNLNNGYSSATGSVTGVTLTSAAISGVFGKNHTASSPNLDALCQYDAELTSGSSTMVVGVLPLATLETAGKLLNKSNLVSICITGQSSAFGTSGGRQWRRLTQWSGSARNNLLVFLGAENGGLTPEQLATYLTAGAMTVSFAENDNFAGTPAAGASNAIGAVVAQSVWGLENDSGIPEIKLKVDSISVTAKTKKLKAVWTPEVAQDLNAYHNLDAEVELTGIMSEYAALEIDQEILENLVKGAIQGAGVKYWSRRPGTFVFQDTGGTVASTTVAGPDYTGDVPHWYETLLERVNDLSASIRRKIIKGGANFIVTSPEVASILEMTSGFKGAVTTDEDRGDAGAMKTGNISKKWDIYLTPYFPRNLMLVGRKGPSFLESGFVFCPYVPFQFTPTLPDPDTFVPRKGMLTRYGSILTRSDFYGLVVILDMLG